MGKGSYCHDQPTRLFEIFYRGPSQKKKLKKLKNRSFSQKIVFLIDKLYFLALWSRIHHYSFFSDLNPAPEGRSWMTFTYNPDRHCVYMYGGLSSNSEPMHDTWILNVGDEEKRVKWEKMPVDTLPPRLWHCSVFVDGALISYGGLCASPPLQSEVGVVNTLQVWKTKLRSVIVWTKNLQKMPILEAKNLACSKLRICRILS